MRRPDPLVSSTLALYLAVGCAIVLGEHSVMTDAWSRVGSASYVLFSRDPHLAAIGFVWGPLPPMLMLPLVALRPLIPALVQTGLAATIVSAVAMALTVGQLRDLLLEMRVARGWAMALALVFALHPMVILYGANGMTEALFLFLLTVTARLVAKSLSTGRDGPLAIAALSLGAAYLVRYEALAAGAGLVALIVARRSLRDVDGRRKAFADAVVLGFPLAVAFASWAVVSWVIVGSPFEQFTSIYGTSAQLAAGAEELRSATGLGSARGLLYVGSEIVGLAPFTIPLVAAVLWSRRRSDPHFAAALATFGAVLAFATIAFLSGRTIGSLRYFIAVIPLGVISAGALFRYAATPRGALNWARRGAMAVATATTLASALIVMGDPSLGREEWYPTQALLRPGSPVETSLEKRQFDGAHEIATYIDGMHLADGAILVDVFTGFPIVLQSAHPRQFVITSDRDFAAVVADPDAFEVRYVLVPPSGGLGGLDALSRAHPGLYQLGPVGGSLVREFGSTSGSSWRLFATAYEAARGRPTP